MRGNRLYVIRGLWILALCYRAGGILALWLDFEKTICSFRFCSLARSGGGWVWAEGGASSRGEGSRGGRGGVEAFVVGMCVSFVSVPGGISFVAC